VSFFQVRILLDFIAIALLLACLAYWWQSNLVHELLGTALFVLVLVHNVFNRRWLGTSKANDAPRLANTLTIVCLATLMTVMLVTSLLISRDIYSFSSLSGAFVVREVHMFVAYWTLLVVALHLGTRWSTVMNVARVSFNIRNPSVVRVTLLRISTAAIAAWGIRSSWEMGFGSKLMLMYTLDMWDFDAAAAQFFVNYASIVGLYVAVGHYGLSLTRRRKMARVGQRDVPKVKAPSRQLERDGAVVSDFFSRQSHPNATNLDAATSESTQSTSDVASCVGPNSPSAPM
jgi:hypothetical protein